MTGLENGPSVNFYVVSFFVDGSQKNFNIYTFLVRSPKDGELLALERDMTLQVSNIVFPEENSGVRCQYSKERDKILCLT